VTAEVRKLVRSLAYTSKMPRVAEVFVAFASAKSRMGDKVDMLRMFARMWLM